MLSRSVPDQNEIVSYPVRNGGAFLCVMKNEAPLDNWSAAAYALPVFLGRPFATPLSYLGKGLF
jgi:hypothetical protein